TIVNDKNQSRVRSMEMWSFSKENVFKTVLIFDKPASIRGTGLLTLREGDNQTQKLYLPALKRVQTIGSSQKGDSFMSSDFSYEDLGQFDTENTTWVKRNETEKEWTISAKMKESKYDSLLIVISKEMSQPVKVSYFSKGTQE